MDEIYCFDSRFDLNNSVEPQCVGGIPDEQLGEDRADGGEPVSAPPQSTNAVDLDESLDDAFFAHGTAAGLSNQFIPPSSAPSPPPAFASKIPKISSNKPSVPDRLIDPALTRSDAATARRHPVSSSASDQKSSGGPVSERPSRDMTSTVPSLNMKTQLSPWTDHLFRGSRDEEEGHDSVSGRSLVQDHEQKGCITSSLSSFKRKRTLRQQHSGHSLQNLSQSHSYTMASGTQHAAPDMRGISERNENGSSIAAHRYHDCEVWRTPDRRLFYVPLDAQPIGYVSADGQYYPAQSDHVHGQDRRAQYGAARAQDEEEASLVNAYEGVSEPQCQYPIPSLGGYQMTYQHVDELSERGRTGSWKRKRSKREDGDLDLGGSGDEEDRSHNGSRRPMKRRKVHTLTTSSDALGQPSMQPLPTVAAIPCFPGPYLPATQLPPAVVGHATQPVLPAAAAGVTLSTMAFGPPVAAITTTPLPPVAMPPPPPVSTAAPPPVVTYNDVGITTKTGLSIWNQFPHLSARTIIRYYPTEVRGGTLEYVRNELEREPNGNRHGSYLERVFAEEHGTNSIWNNVTFRQAIRISKKKRALDAALNPNRLPACDRCKHLVLDCSLHDPDIDHTLPCTQCTDAHVQCT